MTEPLQFVRKGMFLLTLSFIWQPGWTQALAFNHPNQVGTGQSVSVKARKLTDILQELKNRYQVDIIFEGGLVNQVMVTTTVNYNESLERNLDALLKPAHLRYRKVKYDSYLILDAKRDYKQAPTSVLSASVGSITNSLIMPLSLSQPEKEPETGRQVVAPKQADQVVSGKITDENGGDLPGVNILLKGTQKGTTTDVQGNYTFKISDADRSSIGSVVLIFSFVGYLSQEIAVNNRSTINIQLKVDLKLINEVVVVGYGTQKRSDITGAVGSISAKQIQDEPGIQIAQALQGKVAGLQVTQNSGAPGSGMLIRVRGTGTVNNSEPLYVIDGNVNSNPLDLSPDQIENIQILKSASAAAIYGAQGANGVILITTKQGRSGKAQLDISLAQGMQQIQRFFPVANARQYAIIYNEGLVNAGQKPLYPNPDALGEGTNWQKEVFQVAPMTDLTISVNGGNESSKFYFSTGYINQEGIVKGSGFNRANLRINSSHNITPAIRIGQNLSASYAQFKQLSEFSFGSTLGNTLTANPEIPVRMPDGGWGFSPTSLNSANPLASIYYTNNDTKRPVVNGNVYADITFFKDLLFQSQFNFNLGYSDNTVFNPAFRISAANFNDVANLAENTSRFREYSWANTLTYQKKIRDHDLNVLAGVTVQESFTQNLVAFGAGLPLNATENRNLRHLNLATQGFRAEGNAGEWGILSFLGRVNYNYKSKYFTTVNFRTDGSSRFGVNNKFGYYPSFSLGWKLSEEPFMKGVTWVNNLMLRGGWGSLGNQNSLPNYAFADLVTPNINYTFGTVPAVVRGQAITTLGNPDLKWESTQETNIGLDFTGFDNRVTASVDVYNKETTNMLLQIPIVQYSGIQQPPFVNGGSVTNKGIELLLEYNRNNSVPGGFNYSVSGNIAFNKNNVNALSNSGTAINQIISFIGLANSTQIGSPIASFWGWKTAGIFQSKEEISAHAFQSAGTAPGDIRFVDVDGNGVINARDQTIIGNPWPKFIYGLTSSFSYKNLDLSLQFQGTYGNDIFMAFKFRTEGANFFNKTLNVWDNRWTGPNTSNTMPRQTTNDPNNNMRSSQYYVEDGSYLRLRNVQISYRFPRKLVNLRSFRVYASIQNALTFTKYPGFDPELGTNRANNPLYIGIDETNYPLPRIYTLGINIGI